MGTGIFSSDLNERLDALAHDAITTAAVTGSIGSTSQINNFKGTSDVVRVERVAQHAAAWRVAHVTVNDVPKYDHPLVGTVFVRKGNTGQYVSHELPELDV